MTNVPEKKNLLMWAITGLLPIVGGMALYIVNGKDTVIDELKGDKIVLEAEVVKCQEGWKADNEKCNEEWKEIIEDCGAS